MYNNYTKHKTYYIKKYLLLTVLIITILKGFFQFDYLLITSIRPICLGIFNLLENKSHKDKINKKWLTELMKEITNVNLAIDIVMYILLIFNGGVDSSTFWGYTINYNLAFEMGLSLSILLLTLMNLLKINVETKNI